MFIYTVYEKAGKLEVCLERKHSVSGLYGWKNNTYWKVEGLFVLKKKDYSEKVFNN